MECVWAYVKFQYYLHTWKTYSKLVTITTNVEIEILLAPKMFLQHYITCIWQSTISKATHGFPANSKNLVQMRNIRLKIQSAETWNCLWLRISNSSSGNRYSYRLRYVICLGSNSLACSRRPTRCHCRVRDDIAATLGNKIVYFLLSFFIIKRVV